MSVTKVTSYEDLLFDIQNYTDEGGKKYPQLTNLLPADTQVYNLDLNTRTAETPQFLSVQFDHNAEIIYFKCARYFDNMDLANTVCVIEYLNAEHSEGKKKVRDAGIFWVPYYDIGHYDIEVDKKGNQILIPTMYIPWSVGGLATAYSGTITFSVRFYQLDGDGKYYLYNMSTRPKDGEILHGMDLSDEELETFKIDTSIVTQIYSDLSKVRDISATYWVEV